MDTSKKGADIIRNIMGNRNNLLILALLGVLVLVLAIPTEKKTESKMDFKANEEAGGEQLEERLERILKHTEGVGEVRVMITEAEDTKSFASNKENEGTVEGVVVVAQGATDPAVKKKIQDIVIALFPIEAHKIEIVKMKADYEVSMKKIFKKNQLIITGLALMIAAAGYLSYSNTGLKNDTKETASKKEVKEEYEISDEDSKSEEIFTDTEASEEVADASQATSETSAEGMSEEEAESANPGEAVLTSTGAETVNFAAEAKLSREQVRSKNKESLLEIINNKELEEASRQSAIEQMVKMTDTAEKEEAAEMLLEAKGFSNVVVSITDDSADVVLDMGKDATDAKRAQVEDIVKRKTGVSAQNIIITPVDSSAKTQTEK